MRRSKLTAEEILQAEKAKDDRQRTRSKGFSMMSVRDRGWARIRNYNGGEAIIEWPVNRELEEGEARASISDGMFLLRVNGETLAFNTEEFRKWLRWA